MALARADVERPLPAANAELARCSDEVVIKHLARIDSEVVSHQVHAAVIDSLPDGLPSQSTIARRLAMSPRNLQRRLEEEGRSYKAIVEEICTELARDYIKTGRCSMAEVAYLLGFEDTAAFSHAFKRWTGYSPKAYAARETAVQSPD